MTPSVNGRRHIPWLRWAREEQFLSQRELAYTAGVTQATVCRVERGDRYPHAKTQRTLAAALGYRPIDLWPPPGKMSPAPELKRRYLAERAMRKKATA